MYFVLITVGCNCVVVCVNCRIESGILIYFFFEMHALCMLSHIYMYCARISNRLLGMLNNVHQMPDYAVR